MNLGRPTTLVESFGGLEAGLISSERAVWIRCEIKRPLSSAFELLATMSAQLRSRFDLTIPRFRWPHHAHGDVC